MDLIGNALTALVLGGNLNQPKPGVHVYNQPKPGVHAYNPT